MTSPLPICAGQTACTRTTSTPHAQDVAARSSTISGATPTGTHLALVVLAEGGRSSSVGKGAARLELAAVLSGRFDIIRTVLSAHERAVRLEQHRGLWEAAGLPYGECLCGCGARTSIAKSATAGWGLAGEPRRYRPGHTRKLPQRYEVEDRGYHTPCWIWQGAKAERGYGTMPGPDGRTVSVHKTFYERANGPVPQGLHLDHLCRQTSCCNPDHLEPVTCRENLRRGVRTKLTWEDVEAIRASTETTRVLGARYGVHPSQISWVRTGEFWAVR